MGSIVAEIVTSVTELMMNSKRMISGTEGSGASESVGVGGIRDRDAVRSRRHNRDSLLRDGRRDRQTGREGEKDQGMHGTEYM